jgi:hypothetical protein
MTHVRAAWTRWLAGLSMVAVVVATAAAPSAAAEGEILGTGNPNAIENSYLVGHTNTWGYPGAYAIFQDDGNFVIYLGSWPLWHTNTWGTAASLFIVQNDSNIVLYGPYGEVYWHRFQ